MELIGVRAIKPLRKSKRCYALQYFCDVDCPLRKRNQCINAAFLGRCVYGKVTRTDGWTPRAKKYNLFLKEWRQKEKENPISQPKESRVTFIGDYVWLPYSFMNNVDGLRQGIIFKAYSGFMGTGINFMLQEHFTPETIVKLVEFRPQAVFGGTITSYFDEIVPRFLADLWDVAPALYDDALALKPEIEEITAVANRDPIELGWLNETGWYGKATIYGLDCFIYDLDNIKFTLDGISEFPDATGGAEVSVGLPPETLVYPDPANSRFIQLMRRARRAGAVVGKDNG